MLQEVIIEKRIVLAQQYLNSNYMEHLFNRLKNTVCVDCTEEHGHIIDVKKIVQILNHKIDRTNSDIIFNIKFLATTFKPVAGKIIEGIVCMVYKDGIFITIMDRQKMLIPSVLLKGYTFDEKLLSYSNGMETIMMGNTIQGKVTAIKYNKKNFSCFGSLV
jgi:DNA-directed RNA polymerase subunit E'/Rpb7